MEEVKYDAAVFGWLTALKWILAGAIFFSVMLLFFGIGFGTSVVWGSILGLSFLAVGALYTAGSLMRVNISRVTESLKQKGIVPDIVDGGCIQVDTKNDTIVLIYPSYAKFVIIPLRELRGISVNSSSTSSSTTNVWDGNTRTRTRSTWFLEFRTSDPITPIHRMKMSSESGADFWHQRFATITENAARKFDAAKQVA